MIERPKDVHAESVASLFHELNQAAPAGSGWLAALRRRALMKDEGWKTDADAYVQGLTAAGAMAPASAAACRENLARSLGSTPRLSEILFAVGWIALVSAVAVTCWALAGDLTVQAFLALLTAGAGGFWASTRPWLDRRTVPQQWPWQRPLAIAACAVVLPTLTYTISLMVGLVIQGVSIELFTADRTTFAADPQGFPLLQVLAREQYGVDVVLGNADQSWASTTLAVPNSSVASMAVEPGYCHLNMYRANVLRGFGPVAPVDKDQWVQGVMMHEFAHCLDGSRDMPSFGHRVVGTRSLAPIDAKDVRDIGGFLEARSREATQLWREAVADIFAVGYWKLTTPSTAGDLIANLRHKRAKARLDPTHATMCWIDYAEKATLPASLANLFAWADQLRASAPCDLPKPKPPLWTRIKQWVLN